MGSEGPEVAPGGRTTGDELSGTFGRYEIERLLGRGGMGAVYLARQPDLDRQVVIKVVRGAGDAEAIVRFQREARVAAKIVSDNVVQVHDTGTERGVPFIVMEYVDGASAAELLQARGKLPWVEATRIAAGAARGLLAAHSIGVLHRDVKPANILVAKDGRVKIADFGLAKRVTRVLSPADPALTTSGLILGSPYYMSPEQAEGRPLDVRADIYSLGATYFELLTGRPPFLGDSPVIVLSLCLTAPTPSARDFVPALPAAVERACALLLAKDKEKRPASMTDVIALLERIALKTSTGRNPALDALPRERPPAAAWTAPRTEPGRAKAAPAESPLLAVLGVVLALSLIAGLGYFALARRKKPPAPPPPPVVSPQPGVAPVEPEETPDPSRPPAQDFRKVYEQCDLDLRSGDANDVEKHATEAIDQIPAEGRAERARFLLQRGTARMLLGRARDAELDLQKAADDDPEHETNARFVSYCGALLAKDEPLAAKRMLELPAQSVWRTAAEQLADMSARPPKGPTEIVLPFTVNVLNTAYGKTLERLLAQKHR